MQARSLSLSLSLVKRTCNNGQRTKTKASGILKIGPQRRERERERERERSDAFELSKAEGGNDPLCTRSGSASPTIGGSLRS